MSSCYLLIESLSKWVGSYWCPWPTSLGWRISFLVERVSPWVSGFVANLLQVVLFAHWKAIRAWWLRAKLHALIVNLEKENKALYERWSKTVALLQNYQFTTYVTLYEVKAWHKTSSPGFLLPPFIWKVFRISWSFWFPIGYLKSCLPLGVKELPYQP